MKTMIPIRISVRQKTAATWLSDNGHFVLVNHPAEFLRDNRGIRHKLRAYSLSQLLLLLNPQKDFDEFFVSPPSTTFDFGLAMVIVVVDVV
ncbi:hypothetical protein L6452_03113 [Arctium lappa]|uniref:Uncharacterized protein n=1 Tax=Arctium lappa TaxID=4217 RepID=A0ACB9FMK2_ARCLA|nr:hypothetical protein L6452_03113 [Arctium lappa]